MPLDAPVGGNLAYCTFNRERGALNCFFKGLNRLMLYLALCYRYITLSFPFKLFSYPLLWLFINNLFLSVFQFYVFALQRKKAKNVKHYKKT